MILRMLGFSQFIFHHGITLKGDPANPETTLTPDNEREWWFWQGSYRTRGQAQDIRFIPLHEVRNEVFTIYFPISKDQ
jgi:uncharacterized protein